MYVLQLSYPFICWWTSRLLSCPGYYKECCDDHWCTRVSFNSGFLSGIAGSYGSSSHFILSSYGICYFSFFYRFFPPIFVPSFKINDKAFRGKVCLGMSTSLRLYLPKKKNLYKGKCVWVHAKLLQSHQTLYSPMDCSLPGSSVHGILQARILEWVGMPSSKGCSQPRDWTCVSYVSCFGMWILYP